MNARSRPAWLLLLGLMLPTAGAHAHQGHSTQAPWQACADHRLGEGCAWTDATHAIYGGTCRQIGAGLMCVRNRPIVRPGSQAEASGPVTYRWFETALAAMAPTHR